MSADDTWIVSRISEKNPNEDRLWGVFHVMGGGPDNAAYYSVENAVWVFNNPLDAIVQGHRCNQRDYAEYGCVVNSMVLKDLADYHQLNTNNIVKHPRGA